MSALGWSCIASNQTLHIDTKHGKTEVSMFVLFAQKMDKIMTMVHQSGTAEFV
jgi:hypothetical protein